MATSTYEVRTYGCPMNVHDSARIAGLLVWDDPDGHVLEIITRPYGRGG